MKNRAFLSVLLALQIAAAAFVWGFRSREADAPEPFLSFDANLVQRIEISDPDQSVVLTRSQQDLSTWMLEGGLPASVSKVDGILSKLASAEGGWPVATSASTADRFEVTEENFQRHLVLTSADGELADIYLGTSPGYRKVHARHVDGTDVFAIEFSNFEAGADMSSWLDKSVLQPVGELAAVRRVGDWQLEREESGWSEASAVPTGAVLDADAVETLIGRFEGLNVMSVVDAELPAEPKMRFELSDDDGVHQLALFHLEEPDDYVATSNRVDGRFEVATYIAEQMDVALDDLLVDPEAAFDALDPAADAADAEASADAAAADAATEAAPM